MGQAYYVNLKKVRGLRPQLSGFSRTHPKTNTRVGSHFSLLVSNQKRATTSSPQL
ncbi:mCG1047997 [Mus musculus]|nr:mCG1047997 [Mus musculus]